MSGRYLLDTNIVIALLNGEQRVKSYLEAAAEVFIPVIALGELYFRAAKSARPQENHEVISQFLIARHIFACDSAVTREYGRLKSMLRKQGKPIPENDIWIAATALCFQLTLVSRDEHFLQVPDLNLLSW